MRLYKSVAVLCLIAPAAVLSGATPIPKPAEDVTSPAKGESFAPRIIADGDGVILSWIEKESGKNAGVARVSRVCMSRFVQGAWSPVGVIASGENLFANWADTPTVVRASDGSLLATWLRSGALGGSVYDAVVSRSTDDGRTWAELGALHDDGKPAEHGFVSAATSTGTDAGAGTSATATAFCWLDGRAMTPPDAHAGGHDHGGGDMSLRAARCAPTSERPSPPSEILDERTCECCPTDLAIAALGPIVVYRDRGEDETRDIKIVRWLGAGWSLPQAVGSDGWKISGCPVNGPSISASGNDVVVGWWTGVTAAGVVRAARSSDGGAKFGQTIEVDADGSVGRVETVLLPSGDAFVIWQDARGDETAIVLRVIAADGTLGAVHTLAQVAADRSSGFPRAALQGRDLWVVCTIDGAESQRSVKVIRLPVDSLR